MTDSDRVESVLWSKDDAARLERDREEIAAFAPKLLLVEPGADVRMPHGGWHGEIPRWPFERDEPAGLGDFLGTEQFQVLVEYPSAYPMIPPRIYPSNVAPTPMEHSQSDWHVSPDGALCLLQSTGGWLPEASVVEMLQKAAGWRIEYALMKREAIDQMTTRGIVDDPVHDHLMVVANDEAAGDEPVD